MEYEHICTNKDCGHEWEASYSMTADPPKVCPKCNQETAQRLIGGGSGKGSVKLYGQDLVDKVKSDSRQLQADASRNEKLYSNLIGDGQYNNIQSKLDRRGR